MWELIKKRKVSMYPNLHFETVIWTFIDKKKFEIIPINVIDHKSVLSYAQNLTWEWCFPIKLFLALYEKLITEQQVKDIITLNADICSYPFIFFRLNYLIKEKFNFYPIVTKKFCMSFSIIKWSFIQLKKMDKSYNLLKFIKKFPIAFWKMQNVMTLTDIYYKNLPRVKNPLSYKKLYLKYKWDFIFEDNKKNLKNIIKGFSEVSIKQIDQNKLDKKIYNIILTWDMSLLTTEFSLFDIDVFLAKKWIQIKSIYNTSSFCFIQKLKWYHKKTKLIFKQMLISEKLKISNYEHKLIEVYTLSSIINSIDKNTDWIIFVKPIMCLPSEHVSYILKENNFFNLPYVEISYDEHSGLNWIITRLEAFISIIKEKSKY